MDEYMVSSTFTIIDQKSKDIIQPSTRECIEDPKINLEYHVKNEVKVEPNTSTNNSIQTDIFLERQVDIKPSGGNHIQDLGIALPFPVKQELGTPEKSNPTQALEANFKISLTSVFTSECARQKHDAELNNLISINHESVSSSSDSCEESAPSFSTDIDISSCDVKVEGFNRLLTPTHRYVCTLCSTSFRFIRELKTHAKIHTEKQYPSSIRENYYLEDLSTYAGEKKFSCSVCKKRYITKSSVTAHMITHSGVNKFSCSVCEKGFFRKRSLIKHLSIHTLENKFSCSICEKRFSRKDSLTSHMVTHTGEKKFSCSICEKLFSMKGSLTAHTRMLTHSGEKNFSCSVCEKRFTKKVSVTKHMLTHSGKKKFSCPICESIFSEKCVLAEHMSIHSEEKKFSYSVCKKRFTTKKSVTKHMLIHSGEKKFCCSLCEKRFST